MANKTIAKLKLDIGDQREKIIKVDVAPTTTAEPILEVKDVEISQ